MKNIFLLFLLCALAQGAVCPAGQLKSEAAVVEVEHAWMRASKQSDVAALGCILADESEEADSAGSLIELPAMLANAAKPDKHHYEVLDLHARVYGDFAYARGLVVINSDGGKAPVKSRFTDVFVYQDGRWQCVAGHESHFP